MKVSRIQMSRKKAQGGFTILEIIVAITIMGILAAIVYPKLNINKSKGTLLYTTMSEVGKSLMRMKLDTACYPNKLAALYDKTQADQSFCGIDLRESWREPYIQKSEFDASTGNMKISQIVTGAQLSIIVQPSTVGQAWIVRATGVPNEILNDALATCNGTSTAAGKCTVTPGSGTGTLDYVFDENT